MTRQRNARPKRGVRGWVRALHRDAGFFVVGLTIIYAVSGLAVNHIADWDPNFSQIDRSHQLSGPLPEDDQELARAAARVAQVEGTPSEVYRAGDTQLDVVYEHRTLHVDTRTGAVIEEGQQPRLFLRLANWLHLNRGKRAWSFIADGYAVLLLLLAISGLFMLPGRKGLIGRGGLIALAGAAVPVLYVTLSGGP